MPLKSPMMNQDKSGLFYAKGNAGGYKNAKATEIQLYENQVAYITSKRQPQNETSQLQYLPCHSLYGHRSGLGLQSDPYPFGDHHGTGLNHSDPDPDTLIEKRKLT